MKRTLTVLFFLCFAIVAKSQNNHNINQYKYLVLPLKYDFLSSQDKYRLNTLTRYLFKKEGFDVYFDEESLPDDLFKDRCLALYGDVLEVKGGFRKLKLEIVLKDCYGEIVIKSQTGYSSLNNHHDAHVEALREAFKTFEFLNYSYMPTQKNEESKVMVTAVDNKDTTAVDTSGEVTQYVSNESSTKQNIVDIKSNDSSGIEIFYAQPIKDGYQLVDKEPKVVMILLTTADKNTFIVKGKNAIVTKSDGKWLYSENDGTSKVQKVLNIKF